MIMAYCESCGRVIGYKRSLSWGTFFAVLLTAGLWLFLIPFYPLRCIGCGAEWKLFSQPRKPPG